MKVKFILDKAADRDIAQVSIFIRLLKEQVFVCLDFFKLLSWKRYKGQLSMTALLFFLCLCRSTGSLKSSPSNRDKIRKTFLMEGEVFEEHFFFLVAYKTQTLIQFLSRGTQPISTPLSLLWGLLFFWGMLFSARYFFSCFTLESWGGQSSSLTDFLILCIFHFKGNIMYLPDIDLLLTRSLAKIAVTVWKYQFLFSISTAMPFSTWKRETDVLW